MGSKKADIQNKTDVKDNDVAGPNDSEDDELNDLLDNALQDFGTKPKKVIKDEDNARGGCADEEKWENEFSKFQDHVMKELKLVEGQKVNNNENDEWTEKFFNDLNFSSTDDGELLSTLAKGMGELTKDLKNVMENPCEEDLKNLQEAMNMHEKQSASAEDPALLSNLLGNSAEGNPNSSIFGIMPLMQNVLKNLLSKDLLYSPLKDIVDKYPDWLAENKIKLKDKDFDRYENQFILMKKVCEEFESETTVDSEEIKSGRFERILNSMQQMQLCGQPPTELVQNIDYPINENGMPNLDGISPEKCSLM